MQNNEEIISEENLEDITGITCVYVPVNDVYDTIQWYQINLGCEPTNNNPVKPGMKHSIMRFPDHNGKFQGAGLRSTVPALFLVESQDRLGFTNYHGARTPVGCFITPRIQEMYSRFKENGVNILGDIPVGRECGPNFQFLDLDGNLWEIWQP
jgi:hypothetical protein